MREEQGEVRRWRVTGRVQGVSFRYATQREAARLGISSGWAKNLGDGSVEVCARGSREALEVLGQWLWRGPVGASVSDVQAISPPADVGPGFHTG